MPGLISKLVSRNTASSGGGKKRPLDAGSVSHFNVLIQCICGFGAVLALFSVAAPKIFGPEANAQVNAQAQQMSAILFQRGNELLDRGELLEAERVYSEAVRVNPKNAFALANLGSLLRGRGELNGAIEAHRRCFELNSDRARSAYNLAVSLHTAGNYGQALPLYERAITLAGTSTGGQLDVANAYSNLGVTLQALSDLKGARAMMMQAINLRPDHRSANTNLCNVLLALEGAGAATRCYEALLMTPAGKSAEAWTAAAGLHHLEGNLQRAASLYAEALALNPEDKAAAHGLAAIKGSRSTAAPPQYVRQLFDHYADSFDESLAALNYSSPELIARALSRHLGPPGGQAGWRIVDAGCGTGLCGALLRPFARELLGVDISERMVERARARRVYDSLLVGDLPSTLIRLPPASADAVALADVVVYFGDLAPLLQSIAHALERGGLVVLTTEASPPACCTGATAAATAVGTCGGGGGSSSSGSCDRPAPPAKRRRWWWGGGGAAADSDSGRVQSPCSGVSQDWTLTVSGRFSHCRCVPP